MNFDFRLALITINFDRIIFKNRLKSGINPDPYLLFIIYFPFENGLIILLLRKNQTDQNLSAYSGRPDGFLIPEDSDF